MFHILQGAHPISRRLERVAYQAIAAADKSRQVAAARQQPKRRPGRPVQAKLPLAAARTNLSPDDEALITWLWQQRQELDLPWITWLPDALQPPADCFDRALRMFHRASTLAESIHAWIRPYLQVHRGLPDWLAALQQLFWNHHRFHRGKRAGATPAELAGIPDAPSLPDLFASFFEAESAMC